MKKMIHIAGAGLAGLSCAYELCKRGAQVSVYEQSALIGESSAARFAGGMLAPWCEGESAEPEVVTLGVQSADWWEDITPVTRRGTLVVAPSRDYNELSRFARRTSQFKEVDESGIAQLEPDLSGRFSKGLFFANEAHLDPRRALQDLAEAVRALGGQIHLGVTAPEKIDIDCTGMAAKLNTLRSVRGEMSILHCPDVKISRIIRLLHPRIPVYLVPRDNEHYMIGATMVESNSTRAATLRSLVELFSAAFTLHSGFGEATVVETNAGLRPAFPNHLPKIIRNDDTWYLNGLYRHGFLLAPSMAQQLAEQFMLENHL